MSFHHTHETFTNAAEGGEASVRTVERLEYGKFTDGHGMAERMEHAVLCSSCSWPAELLPFCGPRIVGPSLQDNDRLPQWSDHGTVMQPVCTDHVAVLWSRVRSIPEGRSNRPYQRARFLVSDPQTRPGEIFAAMNGLPLEEFVRDGDKRVSPLALITDLPAVPVLDTLAASLLPYILAGVPIVIGEAIAESAFFALADRIWTLLPPPVRMIFSAGWGMGFSQRGRLSLSAGMTACPGSVMMRQRQDGTWQIENPEPRDSAVDTAIAAGRLFLKLIYGSEANAHSPDLEKIAVATRLLSTRTPPRQTLLSANLPWVSEQCRSIGHAAYDIWRVNGVLNDAGNDATAPGALELLKDLWFSESFVMCVEETIKQLVHKETEIPAIERLILWLQQAPKETGSVIMAWDGEGTANAEYLKSLLACSALNLLSTHLLADMPSAEVLNRCIAHVLARSLPDLRSEELAFHDEALKQSPLSKPYLLFLERCEWAFLLKADTLPPDRTEERIVFLRYHGMGGTPACECLSRLVRLDALPDASLLEKLSMHERRGLSECIAWRFAELADKDNQWKNRWLDWACEFLRRGENVLVDIFLADRNGEEPRLSQDQAKSLSSAVKDRLVPSAAEPSLASVVRRQLSLFLASLLQSRATWQWLEKYWPLNLLFLLKLSKNPGHAIPLEITTLPMPEQGMIFQLWAANSNIENRRVTAMAAELLLNYSRGLGSTLASSPIVWLCTNIVRDYASFITTPHPSPVPALNAELIGQVGELFGCLPQEHRAKLLPAIPEQVLWSEARSGLALLLVMLLYPEREFVANREQIARLGRIRKDLQACGIAAKQRDLGIGLAAADFHKIDGDKHTLYPAANPVFWAAFCGLPLHSQSDLCPALDHYGSTLTDRISLCQTYLAAALPLEREKTAEKVLKQFIKPLLKQHLPLNAVQECIAKARDPGEADALLTWMNKIQNDLRFNADFIHLMQTVHQLRRDFGVCA
jgi:hypothetical protein